jgi:UDP-N-acetylmuramyl pentapeptide phosphotransferase/UDP-N-acetylglucosamine-1-phosphate transferase
MIFGKPGLSASYSCQLFLCFVISWLLSTPWISVLIKLGFADLDGLGVHHNSPILPTGGPHARLQAG